MSDELTPEQLHRLHEVFELVAGLPPEQIKSRLEQECGDDKALALEVGKMLDAESIADQFIDKIFEVDEPEDNPEDLIGRTIDGYRITKLVGSGGMGFVFRAERRNEDVDQVVAIKILRNTFLNWPMQQRFKREAKILARLNHPNIARFLNIDRFEGRPYFTMEFVDGQRIDDYCTEKRLDVAARLDLFNTVLEAVAFSQRYLIIHRDLKPQNIFVTDDGDVKVLDFGIGKFLAEDEETNDSLTMAVGPMLSMDVAAPEQWAGGDTTTATDVYALAVVLFKLLSDVLPYEKKAIKQMGKTGGWPTAPPPMLNTLTARGDVAAAAQNRGVTQRSLRLLLRGDLQVIVAKAMAFAPDERYDSAAQFRQDIENFLDDRPLIARPTSALYTVRKFLARNKVVASLAAAMAILISALVIQVYLESVRDKAQAVEIARERDKALASAALLKDVFSSADPSLAGANNITVREALVYNAPRLLAEQQDSPEVQIALAGTVGQILHDVGAFNDAEDFLKRVVELAENLQSNGSATDTEKRAATAAQVRLVGIYGATGRTDEALKTADRIATQIDQRFGEHSLQKLKLLNTLTEVHSARKVTADHFEAADVAFKFAQDHPGLPGRQRAVAINNHALAYRSDVAPPKTLERLTEARRVARTDVPETHPLYARITANLAAGYLALRDTKKARHYYEEVTATMSQQGVPPNQAMVIAAYGLGVLEMSEENFETAEQLFSDALQIQSRFRDDQDHQTLMIRFGLASCLDMNQRLEEARAEYSAVAHSLADRYPADRQIAKFYSRLAALELDLEEHDAATSSARTSRRYQSANPAPDALTKTFLRAIDVRLNSSNLKIDERRAQLKTLYERASEQAGPHAIPVIKIRRWIDEL